MVRVAIIVMVLVLAGLQYRLWVGDGSYAQVHHLHKRIAAIKASNAHKRHRNKAIRARIHNLKSGTQGAERLARTQMGMVKQGETFFLTARQSRSEIDGN